MSAPTSPNAAARPTLWTEPLAAPPPAVAAPERALQVGGITPFTATDYPGQLAAVVFVRGCPWRCGYCHNPHLQIRTGASALAWSAVVALLKRRVGLIDAVVFSGGEPTIDPALADAMREVRALGLGVGLHTGGAYTRRLEEVLPLVDWVGFDIKATAAGYDATTGIADSARHAWASADLLLASRVAHEFRTTLHPTLHTEADILALAQTLHHRGVRHYALQVFRSTGCADAALNAVATLGYPSADCVARVSALFAHFTLRQA